MANIALQLQRMADANTAKQMNWQEKMSNTSHQREVADLKEAGLNPVLSANSGAQSYSTSVDSAVNALGGIEQARLSSAANVKAAKISANAAIQSAMLNFAGTQYSVDNNYRNNPYSYAKSTLSDLASIFSVSKSSAYKKASKANSKLGSLNPISNITRNLNNISKGSSKPSSNLNGLSDSAKSFISKQLKSMNLRPTYANMLNYLRWYETGNANYYSALRK